MEHAIDIGSRPYGQNVWGGKPAGIIGVSPGASGAAMAQQHLHNVLACHDVQVRGQPEGFIQANEAVFDKNSDIAAGGEEFLTHRMKPLFTWIKK